MRPHRALRRWISGGLVMLLLFMQLATAAYACPAELQALPNAAAMAAMPGAVPPGSPPIYLSLLVLRN